MSLNLPPNIQAYSVSFTKEYGTLDQLTALARKYVAAVKATYPESSLLLAVDRGMNERHWHLHGLVVLPTQTVRFQRRRLLKLWIEMWSSKRGRGRTRPMESAQDVTAIARCNKPVASVVQHAIDRHSERRAHAAGDTAFRLPNIRDRVFVHPERWSHLFNRALRGLAKEKPTTSRVLRITKALPGRVCGWCLGPLKHSGASAPSANTRWCSSACQSSASRALSQFKQDVAPYVGPWVTKLRWYADNPDDYNPPARTGWDLAVYARHNSANHWHVTEWLSRLESLPHNWSRVDALRVIRAALVPARWVTWPTTSPRNSPKLAASLVCTCGQLLARKLSATTCGTSKCRMLRHRLGLVESTVTGGHVRNVPRFGAYELAAAEAEALLWLVPDPGAEATSISA